jgi:hypothetical protein
MQLEDLMTDAIKQRMENDFDGFMRSVSRSLDTDGIAAIEGFFKPDALEQMKTYALGKLDFCTKGKRTPLVGDDLKGTIFFDMAKSQLLVRISNALIQKFAYSVSAEDIYPVVNILHGPATQDGVHAFHFDASFLTAAVPVSMGDRSRVNRGQFRIYPNLRSFSTNWLLNKFYWNVMKLKLARDRLKHTFVDFEVGNLYLFYGYRSYHGTEPLDVDILRVNCLLNIGGPGFDETKKKRSGRSPAARPDPTYGAW